MKISWKLVEKILYTALWMVFSWFAFDAVTLVDGLPYLAGMIACGAYIRALDAMEKY